MPVMQQNIEKSVHDKSILIFLSQKGVIEVHHAYAYIKSCQKHHIELSPLSRRVYNFLQHSNEVHTCLHLSPKLSALLHYIVEIQAFIYKKMHTAIENGQTMPKTKKGRSKSLILGQCSSVESSFFISRKVRPKEYAGERNSIIDPEFLTELLCCKYTSISSSV